MKHVAAAGLIAIAFMLAAPGTQAQSRSGAPGQARQQRQRPYYEEDKFAAPLTFPGQVLTASELLHEMEKQARAQLLIENRWAARPVGVAAKDLPGAELMDGLEVLFAGRWSYTQGLYVLAADRRASELRARQEELRVAKSGGPNDFSSAASDRLRGLVSSFTPEQWARMEAGEKLEARDLSPQQWGLMREAMVLDMRDPSGPHMDTPRPRALEGHAQFWLQDDRTNGLTSVEIAYPTVDPSDDGMACRGVLVEKDADGRWRRTDGRPRTGKARPSWTAPGAAAAPADYHRDPRLRGKLKSDAPTVSGEELLQLLYEQVDAPFLMAGEWLNKPVPVAVQDRPVTQVMEALEKHARAHWESVGPVWVLVPGRSPGTTVENR